MTYRVANARNGLEFEVETGESILDAALRQGVRLAYGCRNGTCGTCRGKLVSGTVEYAGGVIPAALTAETVAAGAVLPCSAVPTSDLVIELALGNGSEEAAPRIMPARVHRVDHVGPNVMRLLLKLPDSVRMAFQAGQYINIVLTDGRRRAFSIANAPHDDAFIELHIRYVAGGTFSPHVFADMKEKEILRIEGPVGNFHLQEHSPRPAILMAGGTGFAPLKGILEHAFYTGFGQPLQLYWGARTKADLYALDLPERWVGEHAGFRFIPVLADPLPEDHWVGRTGLVTDAVVADHPDLRSFDVYASGPPAMVEAGARLFMAHGLPPDQLFSDAFTFAHDGAPQRKPA